jgi:hypothetical protein
LRPLRRGACHPLSSARPVRIDDCSPGLRVIQRKVDGRIVEDAEDDCEYAEYDLEDRPDVVLLRTIGVAEAIFLVQIPLLDLLYY